VAIHKCLQNKQLTTVAERETIWLNVWAPACPAAAAAAAALLLCLPLPDGTRTQLSVCDDQTQFQLISLPCWQFRVSLHDPIIFALMFASCTFCSSDKIKDTWEHTISDSCDYQQQHIMMFASHHAIKVRRGPKQEVGHHSVATPASDPESSDVGILPYAFYYSNTVFIGYY
jgi:hypothetical protein